MGKYQYKILDEYEDNEMSVMLYSYEGKRPIRVEYYIVDPLAFIEELEDEYREALLENRVPSDLSEYVRFLLNSEFARWCWLGIIE